MGFGLCSSRRVPGEFPEGSRRVPGARKIHPKIMEKSSRNHYSPCKRSPHKYGISPQSHEKAIPICPEIATAGVTFPSDFMFRDYFPGAFPTLACHFRCFVNTFPSRNAFMNLAKNLKTLRKLWVSASGVPGERLESSRRVPAEFPGHEKVTPNFMESHPRMINLHTKVIPKAGNTTAET